MIVQGPSSAAYRRPLSGSVDQCQDPYGPAIDLVDKAIAFVRDQFAGSRDPPWPADQGVTGQPGCSTAEQAIHPGRGPRVEVGRGTCRERVGTTCQSRWGRNQ